MIRTTSHAAALVLTQGEPTGIGPELLLRAAAADLLCPNDRVFADPDGLRRLASALGRWAERGWTTLEPLLAPAACGGLRATDALEHAVTDVMARPGTALVTAPIDKARCHAQGFRFPGHTEYLAARAGVSDYAMFLVGSRMRVALVTIHVPLCDVSAAIDRESVIRVTKLVASCLRAQFRCVRPRIGVLGLNPHAGEQGLLGSEEIERIAPAIDSLRVGDPSCEFSGPLPADSAFARHAEGRYDALVAMYHDQALGPFKLMHFHDGVNMTLGLPFCRTSPDHGTARDIVNKGVADPSSFFAAISLARGELP